MKPTEKQNKILKNLKKADSNLEYIWNEKNGVPLRMRGILSKPEAAEPQIAVMNFLKEIKDLYGFKSPAEELKLIDALQDKVGNKHFKYQQMFKNYPVFGHEIVVHINRQHEIRGIAGRFLSNIAVPDKPKILGRQALAIVLKHDKNNKPDRLKREPVLKVIIDGKNKPYLAWQVFVEGEDKALDGSQYPSIWSYFIDSQTGNFIMRYNNVYAHTNALGSGTGKYSGAHTTASSPLNTMHNHASGIYTLEDGATGTSTKIVTHDCNSGYPPSPISEDANNNWNAADQGEEVDCHFYTRLVFDYFLSKHGRNSYDNAGAEMHIYAHYGSNTNNAYWNGSYVLVGDGDKVDKDSYCAIDVIAHEWTHAVTEHTAALVYSNQPGALNESMSDVFAALVDGDWLQGEDYWLKTTAPSSRNLQDPTNGGQYDTTDPIGSVIDGHQPDHINDIYTGTDDYGGVHINSGIMNKAAYLIATGGSHRGITICEGLGRDVLGELYYHTLTNYLTSTSDFADMKDAVLDSLEDLYLGTSHYNRWRASIINAFAAVGIGSAVTCPITCWVGPMATCPPSPVICAVAPLACTLSPHLVCPPAPTIICPPSPTYICPPSPKICSVAPIVHCLPGPDPVFNPDIVSNPVLELDKIPHIKREYIEILTRMNIKTVADFISATSTPNKTAKLSRMSGISAAELKKLNAGAQRILHK